MTNTTINLMNKLNTKHNGTFFKVSIKSKLPLKGYGYSDTVEKVVTMTVRKGIDYKAQKSVKEKVENGKVLTHTLPWGKWIKGFEGLFIEHNGTEYVRLYCSPNKSEAKYFLNGKEVKKEAIEWMVRPSYWKHGDKPDAMTVRTENVEVL